MIRTTTKINITSREKDLSISTWQSKYFYYFSIEFWASVLQDDITSIKHGNLSQKGTFIRISKSIRGLEANYFIILRKKLLSLQRKLCGHLNMAFA